MLHKAIVVQDSEIHGKGLFAVADIPEGEILWKIDLEDPRVHVSTINSWSKEKRRKFYHYAYKMDIGWYCGPEDGNPSHPAYFMNHSCDPSGWFVDDLTMVARRHIKKGDEITFDYATDETTATWEVPCNCGSNDCRKILMGNDYIVNEQLQQRYGNHVMSFVLKRLAEVKTKEASENADPNAGSARRKTV